MKKFLIIAALAMTSFVSAQKGTVLVGGNIDYSSTTVDYRTDEFKSNKFSFSPRVGYQFNDNWTVGGEFTISSSKNDSNARFEEGKTSGSRFGAFVRYSVPLNQTFSVFADLGAGFQNQTEKGYTSNGVYTKTKADGVYVGVTPALFINMKKGFGLNFSIGGLGYETLSYDNNGADVSSFNFNFGKTASIGISKNF
ncbi:outer membrane beta-barrel protein [Flavobacterium sp. FlaQc-50]|uniref:outer membrane beta-barrel protein n=1 Tax=unclassified Flavobacterium TaxID=196869 RepID=UPI00375697F5